MLRIDVTNGEPLNNLLRKVNLEKEVLAKIDELFPAAVIKKESNGHHSYTSAKVNQCYNNVEFIIGNSLWVKPSYKFTVQLGDESIEVNVGAAPGKLMLINKKFRLGKSSLLKFSSTKKNFKRYNFDSDKLFSLCKGDMIKFIVANNDSEIDTSSIEVDIQKYINIL